MKLSAPVEMTLYSYAKNAFAFHPTSEERSLGSPAALWMTSDWKIGDGRSKTAFPFGSANSHCRETGVDLVQVQTCGEGEAVSHLF